VDVACFPLCVLSNVSYYPKTFRQMNPEAYLGKPIDLHIQLAAAMALILNKQIRNPYVRVENIQFIAMIVPRLKHERRQANPHQERVDQLYKDVFFTN